MVTSLLQLINSSELAEDGNDSLTWNPGNNFQLNLVSCYLALEDEGFLDFLTRVSRIRISQ